MENNYEETDIPKELIVIYEDEVEAIVKSTGLDKETVEKVLDADLEYLIEKGIVTVGEEDGYERED